MRTARRSIAVFLAVLWLLPALAACAIGLHLLLHHAPGHHPHGHHGTHDESHHGSAEHTSALVAVALHGHHHGDHHEHADAADHSHDVTFSPAKVWQRMHLVSQAATPSAVTKPTSLAPARPVLDLGQPPDRATEALFTAHCSLLI